MVTLHGASFFGHFFFEKEAGCVCVCVGAGVSPAAPEQMRAPAADMDCTPSLQPASRAKRFSEICAPRSRRGSQPAFNDTLLLFT